MTLPASPPPRAGANSSERDKPVLLRVKRRREEALPETLEVIGGRAKRGRVETLLAGLSLNAAPAPLVRFRRLSRAERTKALESAAKTKVLEVEADAVRGGQKRPRAGESANAEKKAKMDSDEGQSEDEQAILCNGEPMMMEYEIYKREEVDAAAVAGSGKGGKIGYVVASDVPGLGVIFADEEDDESVADSDEDAASVDYPSTPEHWSDGSEDSVDEDGEEEDSDGEECNVRMRIRMQFSGSRYSDREARSSDEEEEEILGPWRYGESNRVGEFRSGEAETEGDYGVLYGSGVYGDELEERRQALWERSHDGDEEGSEDSDADDEGNFY